MSFPIFKKLIVNSDKDLPQLFNRLQDGITTFFDYISKKQQLDSILLLNLHLNKGTNQISHTLGKVCTGWQIVDIDEPSTIYKYQASNSTMLYLNSSISCNVSILVF